MLVDAKKFKIKRSEWLSGAGAETKLLDEDGKRDCIGFFLEASGLEKTMMLGLDEPSDVAIKVDWHSVLIDRHGRAITQTQLCYEIISVNDDFELTQQERESELVSLFASVGIALSFED